MSRGADKQPAEPNDAGRSETVRPSFAEAFRFWLKLGFVSFGGPSGQIAIMQTELVDQKRWISQSRFLHALNYCMLLPGPEAQQLAIYIGWVLHRTAGGVVAGALFVIPSMFILWGLSFVYAAYGSIPWIAAIFYGFKPVVVAIVAVALIRIGSRALKNEVLYSLAALAFVALFFFKVPFPIIIIGAGVIGFVGGKLSPSKFDVISGHQAKSSPQESPERWMDASTAHTKPRLSRDIRIAICCLTIWWLPVILAAVLLGPRHSIFQEGLFFSKAAVVTFGGAYAVLPYVTQHAVQNFGWLKPGQMMDGLGLAETTPGPLIMVLQFVGFMGGWTHPGNLSPLVAATLGALITTWVTFTPCFLWILVGAPHIEQLRGNKTLSMTLSAITAAVVGVILNLAIWFALHVFYPTEGVIDWFAIALALLAAFALMRFKIEIFLVVIIGGIAGLIWRGISG
ncbi:MAG: chromate efflux transporter [Chthoniobacterales bacterium]